MTSAAVRTQGSLLKRGDGAGSEVFTTIAEIQGMTGLGSGEAKEIETTSLDSTGVEMLIGLADEGTMQADCNYVPSDAVQEALYADRTAGTLRNFQVILPGAVKTFHFAAYVKSFGLDGKANDAWRGKISLRISGLVTRT